MLAKPVVVIRQAIFPDLARLGASSDGQFRGLYLKIGAVSALVGTVVLALAWLYAERLLELLVGAEYVVGAALLVWLMAAAGRNEAASQSLRVQLLGAAINLGLFLMLVPMLELVGAGVAALAASAVMAVAMLWVLAHVVPAVDSQTPL